MTSTFDYRVEDGVGFVEDTWPPKGVETMTMKALMKGRPRPCHSPDPSGEEIPRRFGSPTSTRASRRESACRLLRRVPYRGFS